MSQARDAAPAGSGRRPALDGIRAVAVGAVIAYHFGYGWARGGFLGVDVFFVLSGYLITGLLLAERERTGKIALGAFWMRRARRLLPALFVVLIAVALWVGSNVPAYQLLMRRDDLVSTLFYYANWHFIGSGEDYFAQFMMPSPVRHTWSLAIEEQFYLAWPIIVAVALLLASGRKRILAGICVAGIVLSVAAMAIVYTPGDPSRAYYGTDARVHELLIGALLAIAIRQLDSARLRRLATPVGIVAAATLIVAFGFLPDDASIYYHGASVALAVVTAALVWSVEVRPGSIVGAVVGIRPMSWIGEISYGLYLWHWPIVLAVTSPSGPFALLPDSIGLGAERLALTFAAATTSYYLLEQPIRQGRMPAIGPSARRFAVATLAAIVAVGAVNVWQTTSTAAADVTPPPKACLDFNICLRHDGGEGATVVAVIGDSIPRSLDPAMVAMAEKHGWTYVLDATGGCRSAHIMGTEAQSGGFKGLIKDCFEKMPGLQQALLDNWHPDVVVDIDQHDTEDGVGADGVTYPAGSPELLALQEQELTKLARTITGSGAKFLLMEMPPVLPDDCGSANKISTAYCTVKVGPRDKAYYSMYQRLAKTIPGVSTFSLNNRICPGGTCPMLLNGMVVRYDGHHFGLQANSWLASTIYGAIVNTGGIGK